MGTKRCRARLASFKIGLQIRSKHSKETNSLKNIYPDYFLNLTSVIIPVLPVLPPHETITVMTWLFSL